MATTVTRVKKIVAEILQRDAATIGDDANLVFDLGVDSLQFVKLIAALEMEFKTEVDEDVAASIDSVNAAAALFDKSKARRG